MRPNARYGAVATLQWAHAQGIPMAERAYRSAAGGGHLAVLRWLWTLHDADSLDRAEVLLRTSRSMDGAAFSGQLAVLHWLRANISEPEWEELPHMTDLCMQAAGSGKIVVVQWLRANGCPWGT